MQAEAEPAIVLNTGRKMPVLGLGTATYPVPPDETITSAVVAAIEAGYRAFDTASVYGSERAVGRGIAAALERGLVAGRDELFITTKLWCTDMHTEGVVPALQQSLGNLGLDYVDLYLVHFPVRLKGEKSMVFANEDMVPLDMPSVWEAMERCQTLGLAKSIGVSNFTCKKILDLLQYAKVPPAVNQVEVHPLWQQRKLRDLCSENGIHITAYSPLGAVGVFWGTNALIECDEIKRISHFTGKTRAQVCLRWAFQQGVSIVVKSFNKERIKENRQIFDWSLNEEDIARLRQLPQQRYILGKPFVSPTGVYKTLSQFWDGEM